MILTPDQGWGTHYYSLTVADALTVLTNGNDLHNEGEFMKRYPVVFSAPQGWGKTPHSQALMKQYSCTSVVDNWTPDMSLVAGAIHMTNIRPTATFVQHMRAYQFKLVAQGWHLLCA